MDPSGDLLLACLRCGEELDLRGTWEQLQALGLTKESEEELTDGEKVLIALRGPSLDLAQLSAKSLLPPSRTKAALEKLLASGKVEEKASSKRGKALPPRYKATAVA